MRVPLGRVSTRVSAEQSRGQNRQTCQADRGRNADEALQWRAALSTGDGDTTARFDADLATELGDFRVGIGSYGDLVQVSAGMRGGFIHMAGTSRFTRETGDSFAVVDITGLEGIEVKRDNFPIGRTGPSGKLLITNLRPYETNRISVLTAQIPMSHQVNSPVLEIIPQPGGTLARFDILKTDVLRFTVYGPDGQPLGPDSTAMHVESQTASAIGYGGRAYFAHVPDGDTIKIITPTDTYYGQAEDIRTSGELRFPDKTGRLHASN